MSRVNLTEDVRPLSEFKANSMAFIKRARISGRPVVLTQHGHSAAVLMDVAAYEKLLDKIDVLCDIQAALEEARDGRSVPHAQARKEVLRRIRG